MDHSLKCKTINKTFRKKIYRWRYSGSRAGQRVLYLTPKPISSEEKLTNWISSKLKNACSVKDPDKMVKRQAMDLEKMLANHISDKGLVSGIYKQLSKLKSKKTNSPMRSWAKDTKENIQMAKKHRKDGHHIVSHQENAN